MADHELVAAALPSLRTFLFDCDGVLWVGDQVLAGAARLLSALRERRIRVLFVTNNSGDTRAAYASRITRLLHCNVAPTDVLCSAHAAAVHLRAQPRAILDPERDRVFVLGARAITEELAAVGVQSVHADDVVTALGGSSPPTRDEIARANVDPRHEIAAVVVGADWRGTYGKCALAVRLLREPQRIDTSVRQRLFVCTNRDATYPVAEGVLLPGSGATVAMVATGAEREPFNVGKPTATLFELARRELPAGELNPAHCLMVGDRLDTDMAFGSAANMRTLLVLTGVSTRADAAAKPLRDPQRPTFVLPSVAALADLVEKLPVMPAQARL